jgi:protease II
MKARYKKDDESLPYFFNEYWYIVRYEEGKNIHFLQKISKFRKRRRNYSGR